MFWPVFIGLVGIALLWRQADEAQRERWLDTTGRIDPLRAVLGSGGWASYARIAAGVGLIITALVLFSFRGGSVGMARDITDRRPADRRRAGDRRSARGSSGSPPT